MTMEKLKLCRLCVRWPACSGSPSGILLACFNQEEQTKLMYFPFLMATPSCRSEQLGERIFFRQRPCVMYKDNAFGNVVAETGRDCGTTVRLSDLSMLFQLCASRLKGEVRRTLEPSARPPAAADSERRHICTTCLFAESVGL